MATGQQAAVLEGVRRIFSGGTVAGLGSESLLRRFATRGDEAAFSAIVARHGPMVLGVCRRALRDSHDVEDAFQATFLVFVRKARSIRDGDTLGPWLYGVAHRVATRARVVASKRRANERTGVDLDPAGTSSEADAESVEIRALIDAEIGRLPERYRNPIILCDLEGCSQPEAAGRLGWTEGSLRGRLARARELLRKRLLHRGLVAPAGAIGGLIATDTASAGRLGEALARSLVGAAAGRVEGVSTTAVTLAREVLEAMMRFKVLSIGLAAFVAGAGFSGAGFFALRATKANPPQQSQVPEKTPPTGQSSPADPPTGAISIENGDPFALPPAKPGQEPQFAPPPGKSPVSQDLVIPGKDLKNPPPPEPADARRLVVGDVILVEVLEALPGRQISGERVVRPDGTISLHWYGDLEVVGLTRREVKVKVIEHLRQYLTDESLGLMAWDPHDQAYVWSHPARSDRVYIDDSPTFDKKPRPRLANGLHPIASPIRPAVAAPTDRPSGKPMKINQGDCLLVEVLQALPGRQIQGQRIVRSDGTLSLGYYGDLKVAGLTRAEAKVKLIEHLRQYLTEEALGLVEVDKSGKKTPVAPERSTRVFIEEGLMNDAPDTRLDALEQKLDRVLDELQSLKKDRPR
jgi:RNA polymerase sigma factor (sigma-70 family)